jgi:uncharacterized protein YyaL (SSP411 family)
MGRPTPTAEAAEAGMLAAPAEVEAAQQLRSAQRTQQATRGSLRILSSGTRCADARYVAYRRSDREPEVVDQWYVVSQLWADAALLAADDANPQLRAATRAASRQSRAQTWNEDEARCHLDKGFVFLDRLWDDDDGGYYPRSNANGSKITRKAQYADDNALAGLALLAAADSADDAFSRDYYIYAAVQEAEYLQESGLWDDTFGGGFWWSTGLGDTDEGKPAQTNALAALFFARLYGVTGDDAHKWAAWSTLGWLDAALFDDQRSLYRWSIRYERPAEHAGNPVRADRYFNYDQSIAIEALLTMAAIDGDQARLGRARAIGSSLHGSFWGRERGGYNLELGVEQVYTSYAAWASMGHLALYAVDKDERWLQMARANAASLTAATAEADGGYAYRHYPCLDAGAPGCAGGRTRWVVDHTRDTAAQAWAQHLQAALAQTLTGRRPT